MLWYYCTYVSNIWWLCGLLIYNFNLFFLTYYFGNDEKVRKIYLLILVVTCWKKLSFRETSQQQVRAGVVSIGFWVFLCSSRVESTQWLFGLSLLWLLQQQLLLLLKNVMFLNETSSLFTQIVNDLLALAFWWGGEVVGMERREGAFNSGLHGSIGWNNQKLNGLALFWCSFIGSIITQEVEYGNDFVVVTLSCCR